MTGQSRGSHHPLKVPRDDLVNRKPWNEYVQAHEEVLNKTGTTHVPWYIVPSLCYWFRNVAISTVLFETLEGLEMKFPKPDGDLNSS